MFLCHPNHLLFLVVCCDMSLKGVTGTNITIKVLCSVMTDSSLGDPYARYAAVARLMMETTSMKCLDTSFSKYVSDMTNTSWDGPAPIAGGCGRVFLGNGIWFAHFYLALACGPYETDISVPCNFRLSFVVLLVE